MLALPQSGNDPDEEPVREIHALSPLPPPPARRARWETGNHRSSSLSVSSDATSNENFTSMSREFNELVLAGSTIENSDNNTQNYNHNGSGSDIHYNNEQLARIGEEELETNPLAIVVDNSAVVEEDPTQRRGRGGEILVQRVKKEEAETKISAWENAKIAKFNNRFKREEAVISGWETEQVQKANSWLKKVETELKFYVRKLEEKRARAVEKMENKVAKAHRKAEERRASAEGKRGIKVARVLELANLMRAVGRPPAKRSFF